MTDITKICQKRPSLPTKRVSRQWAIDTGMQNLQAIGSDHLCKICIANGGSCCYGCEHLVNNVGCQQRNTSCTAWLCGFLKYMLYELKLFQDWHRFWDQVPGQAFRVDFTPEYFTVRGSLSSPNVRHLSNALASDLKEMSQKHITPGFILTLREKLEKNLDRLVFFQKDSKQQTKVKRNIQILSSHFYRFKAALSDYQHQMEEQARGDHE